MSQANVSHRINPTGWVSKAAGGPESRFEAIVAALEPALAAAVLQALDAIRDQLKIDALVDLLASGQTDAVLAALGIDAVAPAYAPVRDAVADGIGTAAAAQASTVPAVPAPPTAAALAPALIRVQFDRLNPFLTSFVRSYGFDLIKEINDTTKDGIRQIIADGAKAGINPRQLAKTIKQQVGLTARQAQAVANFRKELERIHLKSDAKGGAWNLGGKISRSAGGAQVYAIGPDGKPLDGIQARRLRDFRYDKTLQAAIKSGKPLTKEQIDQMVEAYTRKMLKYRAETIATTEAIRAAHMGNLEIWRQAIDQGIVKSDLIRRKWIVAKDERTCLICRPIPGLNKGLEGYGIKWGEKFKLTDGGSVAMPGAHPRCRCTVVTRAIEPSMVGHPAPGFS